VKILKPDLPRRRGTSKLESLVNVQKEVLAVTAFDSGIHPFAPTCANAERPSAGRMVKVNVVADIPDGGRASATAAHWLTDARQRERLRGNIGPRRRCD